MDDDEALGDGEESAISTTKDETTTGAGVSSMDGASSVGGGSALPTETKTPANHFDFGSIALQLTAIEDFHVCYKVILTLFIYHE